VTFYSIPGISSYNSKSKDMGSLNDVENNPKFREFFEARKRRGDAAQTAGFTEGDTISINGEPAVVECEDRDQHSGTIRTISKTSRKSYETVWKQSAAGELVQTDSRRIFE
jgi:hypothetical protein